MKRNLENQKQFTFTLGNFSKVGDEYYCLSNEKSKIGDWVVENQRGANEICIITNEYEVASDIQKTILFSTEKSLGLPTFSVDKQDEVEQYIQNENIKPEDIFFCKQIWQAATNKNEFTREQIEKAITQAAIDASRHGGCNMEEIIESLQPQLEGISVEWEEYGMYDKPHIIISHPKLTDKGELIYTLLLK